MKKIGILIVAYGLGSEEAEHSFDDFCVLAKRKFQPYSIRHAFTSDISRDRLAKRGKKSDSVIKALKKMVFERYTHIYIQSLHLISGIEYKTLIQAVKHIMNTHEVFIRVAKPLLQEESMYEDMVQALAHNINSLCPVHSNIKINNSLDGEAMPSTLDECLCNKNKSEAALVYMAHGTRKSKNELIPTSYEMLQENSYIANEDIDELSANALYVRFARALQKCDNRIYLACMKGSLTYAELVKTLKDKGIKKVALFPFLSLLGGHTLDDMAGDNSYSWKTLLLQDGFLCEAHCISLLQTNEFVSFWLQSLENLITKNENIE